MQSTVHSCATSTAVQVNVLLATQHASPPNSSTTFNFSSAQCCFLPPHLNVKYTTSTQYLFILCTATSPFPLPYPPSHSISPSHFHLRDHGVRQGPAESVSPNTHPPHSWSPPLPSRNGLRGQVRAMGGTVTGSPLGAGREHGGAQVSPSTAEDKTWLTGQ